MKVYKWLKTVLLIMLVPGFMVASGCSLIAQNRWEGRDAQEALNLFGRPRLPVLPTAILYWPKKARALSLCSSA